MLVTSVRTVCQDDQNQKFSEKSEHGCGEILTPWARNFFLDFEMLFFEIFGFRKNFEILIRKFDISKFVSENLALTEKAGFKHKLKKLFKINIFIFDAVIFKIDTIDKKIVIVTLF